MPGLQLFAITRSGLPSPSRSPTAIAKGELAVAKSVRAANVPSPIPSSTETVLESGFATARSRCPSRFMSPIATDMGPLPAAYSAFAPNSPWPVPRSTDTVLAP